MLLTNDGLNAEAESFRLSGVDHQPGERFLDIMPVFAAYGVGCGIHMPLALGFENVIIPKFTPEELGALVRKYKPGAMMGVPSFYERMMHSRDLWDVDLSFFKTTGCGGDTMNPGLGERFNRFLKEHGAKYCLSQGYGMSELSGAATCCYSNIYRDGSSGIPLLSVTIGIFDPETGEELDYNQEGLAHREEYIKMFADCGWEHIGDYLGYSYFRKPAEQMTEGEEGIFCDEESRVEMMRRVFKGRMTPLLIMFLGVVCPQLVMQIGLGHYGLAGVYAGILFLYIAIFAYFGRLYVRYRDKKK